MKARNVSVSSGGECAKDVQGLRTLMVGLHHVERVVSASLRRELLAIDDVSAVRRETNAILHLIRFTARLGELSRHASDLDDWHGRSEGQHEGHLEDDAEGVSDVIDVELVECFGAVSAHEEEALPGAGACELLVQRTDLSRKDKRRESLQLFDGGLELRFIFVVRRLGDMAVLPRIWGPVSAAGRCGCPRRAGGDHGKARCGPRHGGWREGIVGRCQQRHERGGDCNLHGGVSLFGLRL
mmetsp:Transcript_892/g.2125  ORF Transcript_892/g.2125 Transcript_892/m.2125 type:complete len:240 (+) Transcript_892:975-1694(+)